MSIFTPLKLHAPRAHHGVMELIIVQHVERSTAGNVRQGRSIYQSTVRILPCPIGQCHRSLPNCRRLGSVKNVNISDKAKNSQASPPCRRFHLLRPFWGDAAAWEPVITREIVGSVRSLPRTNNHNKERAELWVTTKTAEIFIKMYLGGAWD